MKRFFFVFVIFFFLTAQCKTTEFGVYVFSFPENSIEEKIKEIKSLGVNAIIVSATDEDTESGESVAFFPSSVLPLADGVSENYFSQVIEYAHKYGLKVYAWFNMPNEYVLSRHPDWISILSNGKSSDYYQSDYFQRIIPPVRVVEEEEYRQLLSTLIGEIASYPIDGFDLNDNFQWAEWYDEASDTTLTSSFDSFTVQRFSEETGISISGNSSQEYADFILNNEEVYQRWIEWRAEKTCKLLNFVKSELTKSGKFIPFRPHLLAGKWVLEDYGIDYRCACRIADIPYTMILVDENENTFEKYSEWISPLTSVSGKNIAVSTYLYNLNSSQGEELLGRISLLKKCGVSSINLFNLSLIEENSLSDAVKFALSEFKRIEDSPFAGSRLGVHIVGVESMDGDTLDKTFGGVESLNAKWVRVGGIWFALNPDRETYDFSQQDLIVEKALKHNLNILMAVAFTPRWASENAEASDFYFYPPTDEKIGNYRSPFGTGTGYDYLYLFAKTIASRYKGRVEYFELWNEEDSPAFFKTVNPNERAKKYAKMLFYFYRGIKDGNPDAKVLLGGLADNDRVLNLDAHFLEKILSDSDYPAGNNFDIHNIHVNFKSPGEIVYSVERNEQLLETYGLIKPLWITELSYSPDIRFQIPGFEGGEEGFENYIKSAVSSALSAVRGKVFWTPLFDNAEESDAFKFSGLLKPDFSPKPSTFVFKNLCLKKGVKAVIPHIAERLWHTELRVYNESGEKVSFVIEKYSKGNLKLKKNYEISPLSYKTITDEDLGKNGFAVLSSFSDKLSLSLSFRYGDSPSLSVFPISEKLSAFWVIPITRVEWFDWWGIAVSNHNNCTVNLNFSFYKNGEKVKSVNIPLSSLSKLVGTISDLFGIDAKSIDFFTVSSSRKIAPPIFICGNTNQDRHAFFQGIDLKNGGKYYINHIAEESWETTVKIVNPFSREVSFSLAYYLEGGQKNAKEYALSPFASLNLKAGKDFPYSCLAEINSENPLAVVLQYRYRGKQSVCTFVVSPDNVSKNGIIKGNFPQWFDWQGFAFANFLPFKVNVGLTAFKNGVKVDENIISIPPFSKKVNTVSGFFENIGAGGFDTVKFKSDYPVSLPVVINGNTNQDRHTFYNGEKLKAKQYPVLANYFLDWQLTEDYAKELAKRDLIVLDMEHGKTNENILAKIKQYNPEIKMLAYMTSEEIETDSANYPETLRGILYSKIKEEWWLKNCDGEHIVFWPGTWMLNCSSMCPQVNGERWNTVFADFVASYVLSCGKWDGFYIDNCWSNVSWLDDCMDLNGDRIGEPPDTVDLMWREGMETMLERMNFLSPKLYTGNGGWNYYPYLNGALIEEFTMWDTWFNEVSRWKEMNRRMKSPKLNVLNACGSQDNYSFFRYSLASALISDGYFAYDLGSEDHSQNWFYDEYSVNLGVPLEDGEIVTGEPVLYQDFETGNWEINNEIASVSAEGINGKSIVGNSLNSSEEWNEYLFSPEGFVNANSEIIVEFSYKILEKNQNTEFYITLRSKSNSENYHLNRDFYFGENSYEGETGVFRTSARLGSAEDYIMVFGIKNRGKIMIDNVKVYSDSGTMYSIRRFENGTAIANNSLSPLTLNLNGEYTKIEGKQDSQTNNGERVYSITIPPKDGIIVIKSISR